MPASYNIDKDYLKDTFIKYVKIHSTSNPDSRITPSSSEQFEFAKIIAEDLKFLGINDVILTSNSYLLATIPANTDAKKIAFISHLDTSPEVSGKNVNPVVHYNYDGKDIKLPNENIIIAVSEFPFLNNMKGNTLITTDGTTLLGADDKAGIAIIMTMAKFITENKDYKHGEITFIFTPDEEIGHGARLLDLKSLNAFCAYTLDESGFALFCDENFNADAANLTFNGTNIHPGTAKNRMQNAISMSSEFINMIPQNMRPENTEGRDGFIHPVKVNSDVSKAEIEMIIRSFDVDELNAMEEMLSKNAEAVCEKYPLSSFELTFTEQYRNMKDVIDKTPEVSDIVITAIRNCGFEPEKIPIRGGTDGARLSFMGLPTPNLAIGGYNFHSKKELVCLEHMESSLFIALRICELWIS